MGADNHPTVNVLDEQTTTERAEGFRGLCDTCHGVTTMKASPLGALTVLTIHREQIHADLAEVDVRTLSETKWQDLVDDGYQHHALSIDPAATEGES